MTDAENFSLQSMISYLRSTVNHVKEVQQAGKLFINALMERLIWHDQSKYEEPEASLFASVLPRLNSPQYGTPEYRAILSEIRPAIDHHNEANSHHPEYFKDGISGMNLLDVVEMMLDWNAACKRQPGGDIVKSTNICIERFRIEPQLASVLRNTAEWFKLREN